MVQQLTGEGLGEHENDGQQAKSVAGPYGFKMNRSTARTPESGLPVSKA